MADKIIIIKKQCPSSLVQNFTLPLINDRCVPDQLVSYLKPLKNTHTHVLDGHRNLHLKKLNLCLLLKLPDGERAVRAMVLQSEIQQCNRSRGKLIFQQRSDTQQECVEQEK